MFKSGEDLYLYRLLSDGAYEILMLNRRSFELYIMNPVEASKFDLKAANTELSKEV